MAYSGVQSRGKITRNRFMIAVMSGIGTIIALVYTGAILRYLYPKNASDTPPLPVTLSDAGVTDPASNSTLPFKAGVAGPFYYPTTVDKSVVVGVFVGKIDQNKGLTANNLLVVEQTCTHLGCPVAWVEQDNRYECPCHGSQFNRDLSVYHGPAARALMRHEFTLAGNTLTILKRNPADEA